MKKLSDFKKRERCVLSASDKEVIATINPTPESCLKETELYDKEYLYPFFSIEGDVINEKYKGLKFHAISCPVFLDYVDYRLLEDNRYQFLGTNEFKAADFPDFSSFLKKLLENYRDNEHFDIDKTPENLSVSKEEHGRFIDHRDFIELETNGVSWCQGTYTFNGKALENHIIDNDPNYDPDEDEDKMSEIFVDLESDYDITDYSLDQFKDENGETLKFIFSTFGSYGFDIFGNYSLYFSPKTRLVRLFFHCT